MCFSAHPFRSGLCAGVLAFLTTACLPGPAAGQTAIVGATVVRGDGSPPIQGATIVIRDGRIECVGQGEECSPPPNARVVDASGRFVTPGLVDAHVHFSQTGWIDGRPDGLSAPDLYPYLETSRALESDPGRWHRSYLCTGITAVFDVGGHPWTTGLPVSAEDSPDAAHVRAAGPLITHATRTALMADDEHYTFLPMDTPAEVRSSVRRLVEMGSSAVKVWYLRPPEARRDELDERLMQVGAEARSAGLDLIVHATSLREAKMALRAGAKLLVHSVEDVFVDEEFVQLLLTNDATYAPTLVVGANWTRAVAAFTLDLPPFVDDPGGCVDPGTLEKLSDTAALQALLPAGRRNPEGIFRRFERNGASAFVMAENVRRVHEAGGRVATATDAGNPMTLHGPSIYNEMEALQSAGISAADVVVMSTRNGAIAMDRQDDFGTLEAGKIADLLLLEEDPTEDVRAFRTLTHVMRAGVLKSQGELAWRRPAS